MFGGIVEVYFYLLLDSCQTSKNKKALLCSDKEGLTNMIYVLITVLQQQQGILKHPRILCNYPQLYYLLIPLHVMCKTSLDVL